jgi:hypothetical protein
MEVVKCRSCGASIESDTINCKYCGSIIPENVETLDNGEVEKADNIINAIQNNIDMLRSFQKPTEIIKTVLWFYTIIFTLGIAALFWSKPENKFKKEDFENLKSIIQRNVLLLREKYQRNSNLISQVEILKKEVDSIEKTYNKQLLQRKFIITGSVVFFIIIVFIGSQSNTNKKQEEYKPNSFYEQAFVVEQTGKTIYVTFAVKEAESTGLGSIPADGKLNLFFHWSGAGVPDNIYATKSVDIKESDYTKTVYYYTKVPMDIPNAYTGASWLDTTAEFVPKTTKKGFKMSKRVLVLNY